MIKNWLEFLFFEGLWKKNPEEVEMVSFPVYFDLKGSGSTFSKVNEH